MELLKYKNAQGVLPLFDTGEHWQVIFLKFQLIVRWKLSQEIQHLSDYEKGQRDVSFTSYVLMEGKKLQVGMN